MSLSIRPLDASDESVFIDAVKRSRELHFPWVTPPSDVKAFHTAVATADGERKISYVVVNDTDQLVACINLNEIVRGAFQSAYLGYYAFVPYAGKGLMKQAMALVIDRAFINDKLHRLEANIQPINKASIALVQSLGFRHEGFSPRYLRVNEAWQDHERYALTVEDWQGMKTE